jgi:tryptophan-rich sensory protein
MMDYSDTYLLALKVAAAGAIIVGGVGGFLTEIGPWYRSLRNPWWKPPDWAFGPIWTIILALTTIGAAMAWEVAPDDTARLMILISFTANAILNIGWNLFFFKLRRPDWALVEVVFLWLSILAMIIVVLPFSSMAALYIAPYLVWVSIAALLNRQIVLLNQPFGRSDPQGS